MLKLRYIFIRESMKNKTVIICVFVFSFFLSFSYLSKTFSSHIKALEDYTATVLPQSISLKTLQGKKLLANEKITQSFIARYNNLGTIAIHFDKPRDYTDTISFRIKDNRTDILIYEQAYQAHTFNENKYFTFGFPPIAQSKNREYLIEFVSFKGNENAAISFHSSSDRIIAKYSFPKTYLFAHTDVLFSFLKERIYIYLSYISPADLFYGLFLFLLPMCSIKLLLIFWNISKQLEKNNRFIAMMKYIAPVILFLTTVIVYGYLSIIGADAHHDGALFKPAMDVANGGMLYKDTFFFYGALVPLIQALALLVFGKYLLTLKLLTVFFYGCNVLLIYIISRKFLPIIVSFFISLVWIFMSPYFFYISYNWTTVWSSVYAIFFQLLTSYFLIRSLETKQDRFIVFSGMTTALTFWCRQPVGVFLFFAVSFFFLLLYYGKNISKKKLIHALKCFASGVIGVSFIFFLWIISNHAFNDWWRQSILRAFVWGQTIGNRYSLLTIINALFAPSKSIVSVWTLIPVATVILSEQSFLDLYKGKNQTQPKIILALALIGLASWLQYFPYNDPAHAFWGATPMFSLLALFLYQFIKDYIFKKVTIPMLTIKYITIILILCIFLPDLSYRANDTVKKIKEPYDTVSEPSVLRHIRLTQGEKEWYTYVYNHIQEYFKKNPNGNVITNGPDSLYLTFDPRIKNYQPVYMNWWLDAIYPEYEPNKDAYIKNKQPFLISYFEFLPEGYCRIDNVVRYDSMFLATPCQFLTAE